MRRSILVLIVVCCIGMPASGVQGASLFDSFWRKTLEETGKLEGVIIGLGAYYTTSPYIDVDEDILPIPIIIAEYKRVYIDGTKIGFLLTDDESLKLSAVLSARLQGYDADDSPVFDGMNNRYASIDGGLRLEWENELCLLNLTFLADLFNNHQGQEIKAVISKELFEGFLTPRLGISWQSEDLVDYYYGVSGNEATAGRPVYQPDSALNYIAGVRIAYPLGEHWALIGDLGCEFYGSRIKKSPIVDADEQVTYLLGAVYRF